MLKVTNKYSNFEDWDNSDQNPLFLKKMFPLLVILGWEIRQSVVESWRGWLPVILPPDWNGVMNWDGGRPKDFQGDRESLSYITKCSPWRNRQENEGDFSHWPWQTKVSWPLQVFGEESVMC